MFKINNNPEVYISSRLNSALSTNPQGKAFLNSYGEKLQPYFYGGSTIKFKKAIRWDSTKKKLVSKLVLVLKKTSEVWIERLTLTRVHKKTISARKILDVNINDLNNNDVNKLDNGLHDLSSKVYAKAKKWQRKTTGISDW